MKEFKITFNVCQMDESGKTTVINETSKVFSGVSPASISSDVVRLKKWFKDMTNGKTFLKEKNKY